MVSTLAGWLAPWLVTLPVLMPLVAVVALA